MIQIEQLCKSYDSKKIFQSVSYNFENNQIYALVGVNGIGKSTLMNAIVQYKMMDTGVIKIDGLSNDNFDSKYAYFFIPDRKDMFLNLTAYEYFSFIAKIYKQDLNSISNKIDILANKLKMGSELSNYIADYSLGMKQKTYLMGAFISGARNLILDEPFNGLDPESILTVKNLLIEYKSKNNLIIYSIHNLDLAANFGDTIVFIDQNREVFSYPNTNNITQLEEIFFSRCVVQ
ncbi:ABC transporter ATP-binding protein [Clostridium sp. BNL1100]|uniref:ATP-binding cassette domain-containing protein n=1 Tax=Clostridium sp. BNL1100 TaxID=755731 RepID=UPI00024A7858|nr:ABC transporter ATP-binding protein [Clostridium sp. BNL1100]AEY67387.1 ABC-type multidrug transport system, ATPase component [Clostridium sp. BNL1100]